MKMFQAMRSRLSPACRSGSRGEKMDDWFRTSLGSSVVRAEIDRCTTMVPSGYFARSLQVGFHWADYFQGLEISSRFFVDTRPAGEGYPGRGMDRLANSQDSPGRHYVVSAGHALPFPEKSCDLAVLPHTLDFCPNPHEVLRQVNQILVAEGCLVLVGFNSMSFYGVLRLVNRHQRTLPWNGNYYSVRRVQDWLSLLGFDLAAAGMFAYLPPLQSSRWRAKLDFFEKAGNRWWPGFGGIYIIVGRKRTMAVTPRSNTVQPWYRLLPGIAQPASQRAARTGLRLVHKN